MFFKTACIAGVLLSLGEFVAAGWTLKDDYSPQNFLSKFTFNTYDDPTHGTVKFLSRNDAQKADMISIDNGVYLGTEYHEKVAPDDGRKALRLTSQAAYGPNTMFIANISHMVCNFQILLTEKKFY